MAEEGAPTLYTTDDTGNYVEYEPPAPPAFKDTLPEDIRDSEHLSEVEDGSQLARYYVDLKKNYLSPPESPDGYEFKKPEDFIASDEELKVLKTVAFENGINQKQFEKLMELQVSSQRSGLDALRKQIETTQAEAEKQLKEEWGADYDKKLESAKKVLNHSSLADDDFKQFLEDTRFGDNPKVIKMFAKMADLISEDAFNKPGTGDSEPSRPKTEDGRPMFDFPSMRQ